MTNDIDRRHRFESVAAEIADPVQRYLRRRANVDDADDAYSETLLTVWRRLDDVPESAVLPWVYGVARRVLSNQRRSAHRRIRLVDRIGSAAPDTQPSIPGADDDYPEVRMALANMSEADREVLTLWAWEELGPREIAAVLDTTANAVSLRLKRAKANLAQELKRQNVTGAGHEPVETTEEKQS